MKKLLLLLLCVPLIGLGQGQSKVIEVHNANQFVDAIASNRTILLMEPILFSEIDTNKSGNNYKLQNSWDGPELVIYDVENLNIKGSGEYPIDLLTFPRYGYVLIFENCSNILIDNVNAGHTEKGYCTGGVFYFNDCQNITINNSIMFGSGTVGLRANNVKNLKCNNSLIWGCTYHIMSLYDCMYIEFNTCEFSNNSGFEQFEIKSSIKVEFNLCYIKNNKIIYGCSGHPNLHDELFDLKESISIVLNNCVIENNKACYFSRNKSDLTLNNALFQENNFMLGQYED